MTTATRAPIRWGGAHTEHVVFRRVVGTIVQIICLTCAQVVLKTDYAG